VPTKTDRDRPKVRLQAASSVGSNTRNEEESAGKLRPCPPPGKASTLLESITVLTGPPGHFSDTHLRLPPEAGGRWPAALPQKCRALLSSVSAPSLARKLSSFAPADRPEGKQPQPMRGGERRRTPLVSPQDSRFPQIGVPLPTGGVRTSPPRWPLEQRQTPAGPMVLLKVGELHHRAPPLPPCSLRQRRTPTPRFPPGYPRAEKDPKNPGPLVRNGSFSGRIPRPR
jgi:hypothetical protein